MIDIRVGFQEVEGVVRELLQEDTPEYTLFFWWHWPQEKELIFVVGLRLGDRSAFFRLADFLVYGEWIVRKEGDWVHRRQGEYQEIARLLLEGL